MNFKHLSRQKAPDLVSEKFQSHFNGTYLYIWALYSQFSFAVNMVDGRRSLCVYTSVAIYMHVCRLSVAQSVGTTRLGTICN